MTLRQLLTADTNESRARQVMHDREHDGRLSEAQRATLAGLGQLIDRMTARDASARPVAANVLAIVRDLDRDLGTQRSLSVLSTAGTTVVPPAAVRAPPPPPPPAPIMFGSASDANTVIGRTGATVVRPSPDRADPRSHGRGGPMSATSVGTGRASAKWPVAAALAVSLLAVGVVVVLEVADGSSADTSARTDVVPGNSTSTPAVLGDGTVAPVPSTVEISEPPETTPASAAATPPTPSSTLAAAPVVESISPLKPRGVVVDDDGSVIFTDDHRVVRIRADGSTVVLAGTVAPGILDGPEGVAVRPDGTIVLADNGSNRIMSVSPSGVVTVLAGTGAEGFGGDGGTAVAAVLDGPVGVATMPDGSVVFADNGNNRIRRIDPNGVIVTVAGTGAAGLGGDGLALASALDRPQGVAVDTDGSIIIADTFNHRIRRLGTDGTIVTIAGTGTKGSGGDGGRATSAQLSLPVGVAVLPDGSIAVADYGNGKVRVVHPDGTITTLAGAGSQGDAGDDGPATVALLNKPQGVAVTPSGAVVVTDTENSRLRIIANGTIVTLLG